MKKRGQLTIFIIIAVIVLALLAVLFMFYPSIMSTLGFGEKNPEIEIQNCIEEEIEKSIETLSLRGGSLDPEHYIFYDDEKVEYLCYTGEYYKTCVMQQPLLKQHIEKEIEDSIEEEAQECFDVMTRNYEKAGYSVSFNPGQMSVELLPKRVVTTFNSSLTLKKGDSKSYDSFSVVMDNNLYELVSITNSILNWEAHYGDSETTTYMNYYHDLRVEKKKQSDGSTVYILTDRNNGNKFQFASRSLAWPPGYGTDGVLV